MQILVPQVVDRSNNNSGALNVRALLGRFQNPEAQWTTLHYHEPDPAVAAARQIRLVRLWRRHLWLAHVVMFYQREADAVFYPGAYWFDEMGLAMRSLLGRQVPVIATFEGLLRGSLNRTTR